MTDAQVISTTEKSANPAIHRLPLSYPLSPGTAYPDGGQPTHITPVSQLTRGDAGNTYRVEFWNHIGTHIDGPGHMTAAGPFIGYCPPTGLFFTRVSVVDIECPDSKLIVPDDLKPMRKDWLSCEMLLLRTGFSACRESDPKRYANKNPGISTAFASFLVENFPNLVCVGIDAISFAAAEHVVEGIEAHKILFRARSPILLVEDMNLAFNLTCLQRVLVIPFLIEQVDSCPCTVIAEVLQPDTAKHHQAT